MGAQPPGKIALQPAAAWRLVHVLQHHPAELEYDWTVSFGFGLAELVTGRITVGRAIALTDGIIADPTSHTRAALLVPDEIPSEQVVAAITRLKARGPLKQRG